MKYKALRNLLGKWKSTYKIRYGYEFEQREGYSRQKVKRQRLVIISIDRNQSERDLEERGAEYGDEDEEFDYPSSGGRAKHDEDDEDSEDDDEVKDDEDGEDKDDDEDDDEVKDDEDDEVKDDEDGEDGEKDTTTVKHVELSDSSRRLLKDYIKVETKPPRFIPLEVNLLGGPRHREGAKDDPRFIPLEVNLLGGPRHREGTKDKEAREDDDHKLVRSQHLNPLGASASGRRSDEKATMDGLKRTSLTLTPQTPPLPSISEEGDTAELDHRLTAGTANPTDQT